MLPEMIDKSSFSKVVAGGSGSRIDGRELLRCLIPHCQRKTGCQCGQWQEDDDPADKAHGRDGWTIECESGHTESESAPDLRAAKGKWACWGVGWRVEQEVDCLFATWRESSHALGSSRKWYGGPRIRRTKWSRVERRGRPYASPFSLNIGHSIQQRKCSSLFVGLCVLVCVVVLGFFWFSFCFSICINSLVFYRNDIYISMCSKKIEFAGC